MTKQQILIQQLLFLFPNEKEMTINTTTAKRDWILNQVATQRIYQELFNKYFDGDHKANERDEFKSYIFTVLCEKPSSFIEGLWERKEFMYYLVGLIRNSLFSFTSPYYLKFKSKNCNNDNIIPDSIDYDQPEFLLIEEEQIRDRKVKLVEDAINYHLALNPHLKTEFDLFNLYYRKNLSYRDINKLTNIPLSSCHIYVKTAFALVKKYIKDKQQRIK